MPNQTKSSNRVATWLWRQVERHQRRPRWQRLLINVLWIGIGTAIVYFWATTWDCPIC